MLTLEEVVASEMARPHFLSTLVALFAALALPPGGDSGRDEPRRPAHPADASSVDDVTA
jgi:hypothetical protein